MGRYADVARARDARPAAPREQRGRLAVPRPPGAPRSFTCERCKMLLWDEVDYTWCPRCSTDVDWIDPDRAHAQPQVHEAIAEGGPAHDGWLAGIAIVGLGAAQLGTLVTMALDPIGRVYVSPFLLLLVIGAVTMVGATVGALGELRALARDRTTRVVHGLEHACIALLRERGVRVIGGQTSAGRFSLDVPDASATTLSAVAAATRDAIARIRAGARGLAYTPQCGTSLLVAVFAVSLAIAGGALTALILGASAPVVILGSAIACVAAFVAARPLGLLAQHALTVSTQFTSAAPGTVSRALDPDMRFARFTVPVDVTL